MSLAEGLTKWQATGPSRGIARWNVGVRWATFSGDALMGYAANRGLNRYALSSPLQRLQHLYPAQRRVLPLRVSLPPGPG